MKAKMILAGRAAWLTFAGLGVIESAVLIYKAPWLVVFLAIGFYAAYDFLSGSRSGSGLIRKLTAVDVTRWQRTARVQPEVSPSFEGRWYESPKLAALMDLGLTSDDARAEVARQARYSGGEI